MVEHAVGDIVCLLAWHIYRHVRQLPYQLVCIRVVGCFNVHDVVGRSIGLRNGVELGHGTALVRQGSGVILCTLYHWAVAAFLPARENTQLVVEFAL